MPPEVINKLTLKEPAIIAVTKLLQSEASESEMWNLSAPVTGQVIKPKSITCDPEGHAYVSDGVTNRILKINSLTGEILGVLLVGEEQGEIRSICWSNTEPNLTVLQGNPISTYFMQK